MNNDNYLAVLPKACLCGKPASVLRFYKDLNLFIGYCDAEAVGTDIKISNECKCGEQTYCFIHDAKGNISKFLCKNELLKVASVLLARI